MDGMYKSRLLHASQRYCVWKHLSNCLSWAAWLFFSWNTFFFFYLKEWLTENLWLSRLEYMERFIKNEWIKKKRNEPVFIANSRFQGKIRIFRKLLFTTVTVSLTTFKYLKIFLMRLVVSFWYCIMKYVNIWNISEQYFKITNAWCYKVRVGSKYFNGTEYKEFIDIVSDFMLPLTFKKLLLIKFCHSVKE